MGHITEPEAMKIVHDCESALHFKEITEEDVQDQRLVQFPQQYLGEYEELNEDTENPNSAILALFQYQFKTYETQAVNSVLFQLLKEPFFNDLRTQQ